MAGLWLAAGLFLWLPALQVSGQGLDDATCLECHTDPEIESVRAGKSVSLYVDEVRYSASVHADVECVSCHADIEGTPHVERLARVDCGACHDDAVEAYAESIHGLKASGGDLDAPGCASCHGTHAIVPVSDKESPVTRLNVAGICIDCHVDEKVTAAHARMPAPETVKAYASSVHGHGLFQSGLTVSAICTDCHGAHTVKPADDSSSPAHRGNIPTLCGQCHPAIVETYGESVHGRAFAGGVESAPVCTDCHGEHTIAAPSDPGSTISPGNVPKTCGACHEETGLADGSGLPGHRYTTYLSSYHGVVNRYGEAAVANCASCHGIHDIRPSSDPKSLIHADNLGQTCGTCHPGLESKLAGIRIHVEPTPESSRGMYYVRTFYTYLIGVLMVCFLAYMSIDIYGSIRRRRRR